MKKTATLCFYILFLLFFLLPHHNLTSANVDHVKTSNESTEKLIITFEEAKYEQSIEDYDIKIVREYKDINTIVAVIDDEEVINELVQDPRIIVEKDHQVKTSNIDYSWGFQKINGNTSHQSGLSGNGVRIAVLDTGISQHEHLNIAGGQSFLTYTNSYYDDNGHGTEVAGVIAARHSSHQMTGVAPEANLYALKVLNQEGIGYVSDIIAGIEWSITNRMDIINLSLGLDQHSVALQNTINRAYEKGILVVAAAGNSGIPNGSGDNVSFPARYASVIAVGAVDSQNRRLPFSATGPALEMVAPGEGIYSTTLNNQYSFSSGTSIAAPFVTGILALFKEANPKMSANELRSLLRDAAIDLGPNGKDPHFGYGLVQAPSFLGDTGYFEVVTKTPVYDNSTGRLLEVGHLLPGEVYPRIRDFGNWHEIQFGNSKGYIRKSATRMARGSAIQNENKGKFTQGNQTFQALKDVTVYDNTSGRLVPFGVIKQSQRYPIVSDFGNWWRVELSGRIGFVRKSEVRVTFTSSTEYFRVIDDQAIVYDNSTGRLVEVGKLERGQVYPRVRDFGNWHEISFGSKKGYVRKSSTSAVNSPPRNLNNGRFTNSQQTFRTTQNVTVFDNSSGSLVPFATILSGQRYPIVSDFGNWWRIDVSGRIGFVRKSEVALSFTQATQYFQVVEENTPVYDNSTGRLIEVARLQQGQVYPRVRDFGNWHEISFGNGKGYVRKSSTKVANGAGLRNENKGSFTNSRRTLTTLQGVVVFDNTSGSLVPFATLVEGRQYPIVSDFGNWWRIDVSGRIGFVRKSETRLN
ncbi:S8 family serine peptidase [Alkalihalobacterium sp. APHAB7]|uniref:S8 family serine peptidase n=1 Tax=Alkalihalobacterium sp. APHAB7 TaxID=3402081 RepID=UPI003AAE67A1